MHLAIWLIAVSAMKIAEKYYKEDPSKLEALLAFVTLIVCALHDYISVLPR